MPAVSATLPYFVGSQPDGVRLCFEEYGLDELAPGDVMIFNDPYRQGTHLNDTSFIRPMFHEGQLVGALALRCHLLDMGGVNDRRLRHDQAVALPRRPRAAADAGVPQRQAGEVGPADVLRQHPLPGRDRARHHGHRRHVAVRREPAARLHRALRPRRLLRRHHLRLRRLRRGHARRPRRAARRRATSGEELLDTDSLPDSEPYRVKVTVTSGGAGPSSTSAARPSRRAARLNSAWPDTKTAVTLALTCLVAPEARFTSASCATWTSSCRPTAS